MQEYRGHYGRIAVDNWGTQVAGAVDQEPPLPAWFGRSCSVGYERADGWTRRTCIRWQRGKCSVPAGMTLVGFSRDPSFIAPGVPVIVRCTRGDVIATRMTPMRRWLMGARGSWRSWMRGRMATR